MELKMSDLQAIIYKQIAAEVISKLDTSARDSILAKAVAEALESYSYKQAIEKAVCEAAAKIATELISGEEYQTILRERIDTVLTASIQKVSVTIPEAMLRLFGGKDGPHTYDRGPGLLHSLLKGD